MQERKPKPRYHNHTGHMHFSDSYAICEGCEQMWKMGRRPPTDDEIYQGITQPVKTGWIPDDPNYEYRDRPTQKFRRGKKARRR